MPTEAQSRDRTYPPADRFPTCSPLHFPHHSANVAPAWKNFPALLGDSPTLDGIRRLRSIHVGNTVGNQHLAVQGNKKGATQLRVTPYVFW